MSSSMENASNIQVFPGPGKKTLPFFSQPKTGIINLTGRNEKKQTIHWNTVWMGGL